MEVGESVDSTVWVWVFFLGRWVGVVESGGKC